MTTDKAPSWDQIELDYRAGIKSLRQIAADHGITHGSITKRAKRDDWSRDLSKKIKAKAADLVSKDLVSTLVSTEKRISEKQLVDANATASAAVQISQRKDIQRSRSIAMRLFDELEHVVGVENAEQLESLGELLRKPDERGQDKLNDIYQKMISLPNRVKSAKDLAETLRVLIGLERQAFGLDDKDNSPVDPLTQLLHGISKSNSNSFAPIADDPEYDDR